MEIFILLFSFLVIVFIAFLFYFFFYIPPEDNQDRLVSNSHNTMLFDEELISLNNNYILHFVTNKNQVNLEISGFTGSVIISVVSNLPNDTYMLKLTTIGQLEILNSSNFVVWTMPTTPPSGAPYMAILSNNGSFCIYNTDSISIWCNV